ncbi:hypothetical protein [Pannonibacter indicus]|uniref:hypothetical protein n=1 Tax=Pannonibacter indicus TaxID=466044 RepID=UPI0011474FB9|nr:hypothetical protein [Pannonibacter indicus]
MSEFNRQLPRLEGGSFQDERAKDVETAFRQGGGFTLAGSLRPDALNPLQGGRDVRYGDTRWRDVAHGGLTESWACKKDKAASPYEANDSAA